MKNTPFMPSWNVFVEKNAFHKISPKNFFTENRQLYLAETIWFLYSPNLTSDNKAKLILFDELHI